MTSFRGRERMDIVLATSLDQEWTSQSGDFEKAALNRLKPKERQAMDEVVYFLIHSILDQTNIKTPQEEKEINGQIKSLVQKLLKSRDILFQELGGRSLPTEHLI